MINDNNQCVKISLSKYSKKNKKKKGKKKKNNGRNDEIKTA